MCGGGRGLCHTAGGILHHDRRLAGGGGPLVCLAVEDCQALTDHQHHGVEGRHQQAGEEKR